MHNEEMEETPGSHNNSHGWLVCLVSKLLSRMVLFDFLRRMNGGYWPAFPDRPCSCASTDRRLPGGNDPIGHLVHDFC